MSELRTDAYLGGRVQITQPAKGYRAGTDPVLLAAAVPALAGQTVLELG
ncbi:MAG: methyltransferase, partial [Pseudomonadota bacterium]